MSLPVLAIEPNHVRIFTKKASEGVREPVPLSGAHNTGEIPTSQVRSFLRPEVELKDLTPSVSDTTLLVYVSMCFLLTILGGVVFAGFYFGWFRSGSKNGCCGSKKKKFIDLGSEKYVGLPTTVYNSR